MAIITGNQAQLLLDGFNVHQFARSFSVSPVKDIHDSSVLGTTSRTKLSGLTHATASGEFFVDDTLTSGSLDVLKSKYGAAVAANIAFAPAGFALGNSVVLINAHEAGLDIKAVADDLEMITLNVEAAEDGAGFGVSLHALSAETSFPITGASVDNGAATTNGGVAVLHVTAIAGASPEVEYEIQHATDGATWVALLSFGVLASGVQRAEVAAGTTIRRYLRVIAIEGGTTSSVTAVAAFARR